MNQDKVDFLDIAKFHRVTDGSTKPEFTLKVDSAEVHFALARADFEKCLTDVP